MYVDHVHKDRLQRLELLGSVTVLTPNLLQIRGGTRDDRKVIDRSRQCVVNYWVSDSFLQRC